MSILQNTPPPTAQYKQVKNGTSKPLYFSFAPTYHTNAKQSKANAKQTEKAQPSKAKQPRKAHAKQRNNQTADLMTAFSAFEGIWVYYRKSTVSYENITGMCHLVTVAVK